MRRRSAALMSAAALALLVSLGLVRAASPALSFASLLGLGEERCEGRASWGARNPGAAGKCLPPVPEIECFDAIDNDSDEMADYQDPDCNEYYGNGDGDGGSYVAQTCAATEADLDGDCFEEMGGCTDAYDNDANGSIDCEDGACAGRGACAGVTGSGLENNWNAGGPNAGDVKAKDAEDIVGSPADVAKLAGTKLTPAGYACDYDGICEGPEFDADACSDCNDERDNVNEIILSLCDDPENDGLPIDTLEGQEATPPAIFRCAYEIDVNDPYYFSENVSLEFERVRSWTLCHDGVDNDKNGHVDCRDDDCYAAGRHAQERNAYDEDGNPVEGFDAAKDWEENADRYQEVNRDVGCYCGDGECTTNYEDSLLCPEDCG
jgi:hypothetical protein